MNPFRREAKNSAKSAAGSSPETVPLPPFHTYCRICDDKQTFTKRWRRIRLALNCEHCGIILDEVRELIDTFQPACPRCEEFLEQPAWEYGICDGCASKYELLEGTQPNLLPNKFQREQMDRIGKTRRHR